MHAVEQLLALPDQRAAFLRSLEAPHQAPFIRCAKIKITARCNLRCSFCNYWRMDEPDEFSTEEYCRVLEELAAAGCVKVHFSGGEATLRKDVFELIERCSALGMKANITTNCTMLNAERAERFIAAGTHSLSTSLDGPDARSHDALRSVPGAFERTIKGVRLLRKARDKKRGKMKLRLNTVLTRHNFQRLPEIIELAADLGFTEVHPMPVDERGDEPKNRLDRRNIERFNTFTAPLAAQARERAGFSLAPHLVWPFGQSERDLDYAAKGRYARGYFEREKQAPKRVCFAPWTHIFIGWSGDVFLCCMARGKTEPLGNLRGQSIAEVWNGQAYRAIRQQFQNEMPKVCHRCDMFVSENQRIELALAS